MSDGLGAVSGCGHGHLVAFYETDDFLVDTVAAFCGDALRDGDAAIVVATAPHRAAFEAALRSSGIDVEAAVAAGRYLAFDAAELLAEFMLDGAPDPRRFRATVGPVIERAARGRGGVRIYREMVALLWELGDVASVLALEDLWNDLAAEHALALLCAYPMRAFADTASAAAFARICEQHVMAIPAEGYALLGSAGERERVVARLQQQNSRLRADIAQLRGDRPATDGDDAGDRAAQLDRAERAAGMGSWQWSPQTGELSWSANYYRMLGFAPDSIAPSNEAILKLVHPADAGRMAALGLDAIGADGDIRTTDYRIVRGDGLLRHHRAIVSVARADGEYERHIGLVQDVTAETQTARKLAGQAAVSKVLDEWHTLPRGAEALLSEFARAMDLCLGVLWIPHREVLVAKAIWHPDDPRLARIAEITRDLLPGRGAPTLGDAWQSRQPIISNDPAVGATRPRAAAVRVAGIQAVLAIPAVAFDETLAVLEFFSCEHVDSTAQLQRSLTAVGHEIGQFLSRRRGQLVAPVLSPRETQVLQLAADTMSAADIALQLHLSPSTVKRHFEKAYAKLAVNDRAGAVAKALREGLIV